MQSASSPREESAEQPRETGALIQHLAHELRQPLSGIEAAAYYIDMVVSEARPDLIPHCRRLRRMVQQASWLLADAALSASFRPEPRRIFSLADICASAAARLFFDEDAVLDLHLPAAPPAVLAPETLPQLIDHLLAFFRDAAGCPDPIHVRLETDSQTATATWWSDDCEDPREAARLIAPGAGCGFLERFALAAGGWVRAEAGSSRLMVELRLPLAAEHGA